MPESVKRRGSSGPTSGAMPGCEPATWLFSDWVLGFAGAFAIGRKG